MAVVPLSTLEHWKRECDGWSRMVSCVYHDIGGGKDMRDVIREFEWYYKGRSRRLLKFNLLITTYDDLIKVRQRVYHYFYNNIFHRGLIFRALIY